MAKGIRINDLAKELGVPSKLILEKCIEESIDFGGKKPTGAISISMGLAETIKDWHAEGAFAQAESSVAVAEKPARKAPARKKKAETPEPVAETPVETPPTETPAPAKTEIDEPVKVEVAKPATKSKAKKEVVEETVEETPVVVQETPKAKQAPIAPIEPTPEVEPTPPPTVTQVATPVAEARPAATTRPPVSLKDSTAPAAPTAGARGAPPVNRPTISLDERLKQERASQPPPFVPKKAEVKGPELIREEKPDFTPTPRAKSRGPAGPTAPPAGGVTPARPTGGRGVRSAEDDEEGQKKKGGKGGGASRSLRRSPDGRRGEADEKLREFTEADIIERRDRLREATSYRAGMASHLRKSGQVIGGKAQTAAQRGGAITIQEPITVKSLSAALGVKVNDIIGKLMKQGVFATINQVLDFETAQMLAGEWGVELEILRAKTMEELFMEEFDARPRDEEKLVLRPPVVTILGHVDHGKTSLLDRIRSANVAAGEAGGITQHIAAFSVELDRGGEKKRVTFIDTPGHQAFTAMRARGANMTDVVVLVIDAAQGIQPQTVESINHARAAGVPIVVAMNKIDLADANPDMVMGQLAQHELSPVAWGGTTEVVQTSGKTGQGIEELIEILDLQSQILELKADPTSPARGVVIEGYRDPGLGPVATVLVQDGTLKVGDVMLAGEGYGRIRALYDSKGNPIQEAGPSTPVVVSGLNAVPSAGDKFFDMENDVDRARAISAERTTLNRQTSLAIQNRASLQNISDLMKQGDAKLINLIVKADVAGSIETLEKTVMDQNTSEVQVKLIHAAVGPINESDVELATASDAVIIGFHVVAEPAAQALAEARKIEIRTYRVIYEIFDDLKKALSGMLEPEIREKHHGWIEIRQVFKASKIGNVAGCMVTEGHVSRGSKIRLTRDGNVITEGLTIDTLRRVKDDVKEVKAGFECGMKLQGYDDIKIGDRLEAYIREEIKRTL